MIYGEENVTRIWRIQTLNGIRDVNRFLRKPVCEGDTSQGRGDEDGVNPKSA